MEASEAMGAGIHRTGAARASLGALALLLWLSVTPNAVAGGPVHDPLSSLTLTGTALDPGAKHPAQPFNQACGTAVDSKGDVYVASAGNDVIDVFNPAHEYLTSIEAEPGEPKDPCGLAVDSTGHLYVSEKATGKVVRYTPNAYPLSNTPTYGSAEPIDESGKAKGIAVDPVDDHLYVAEGSRIVAYTASGHRGIDEVQGLRVKCLSGESFTLSFEGQSTPSLPCAAEHSKIQAALEALSTIGAGNVSVVQDPLEPGNPQLHRITFTGALGSKDVEPLAGSSGCCSISTFPQGWDGFIGEGDLGEATGTAAYTYRGDDGTSFDHLYIFAVDAATDTIKVFGGGTVTDLSQQRLIDGSNSDEFKLDKTPDNGLGFGTAGASLTADSANGHIVVYDDEHQVVDEFEASGRFLSQIPSPEPPSAFADAQPTGIAVVPQRDEIQRLDTSCGGGTFTLSFESKTTAPLPCSATAVEIQAALEGLTGIGKGNVAVAGRKETPNSSYIISFVEGLGGQDVSQPSVAELTGSFEKASVTTEVQGSGPGRVYVTEGSGTGAKVLAFAPLATPQRPPLPAGDSFTLKSASSVAVDFYGNRYVGSEAAVHIYPPGSQAPLLTVEDKGKPFDLAVDSECNLYTLDHNFDLGFYKESVKYFTPSSCPPTPATTYTEHEPILKATDYPGEHELHAIGIDPATDQLYVARESSPSVIKLGPARDGSPIIVPKWGSSLGEAGEIDVCAATGAVYVTAGNGREIKVLDSTGSKVLDRITGRGSPKGKFYPHTSLAVDQANCHVVAFAFTRGVAEEYESSGAFVAEFDSDSADAVNLTGGVAVDGSCVIHRNEAGEPEPLGESTTPTCNQFDPANGNAYVAFDDPENAAHPYDLAAFGPLTYAPPPNAITGVANGVGGGQATLHGTVDPRGSLLTDCRFEYTTEDDFQEHGFALEEMAPCAEDAEEVGSGTGPVSVHAQVSGLDPEGRYRFRLVAVNTSGASEGEPGVFGPPRANTGPAQPISYTEATLSATVDPSGLPSKYHFEYGESEAYGQATPPITLAASVGETDVSVPVFGLTEGRTYHFRIVAENEARMTQGLDETMTMLQRLTGPPCPNDEYRTGLSANLPDCRAYELVTPADTAGLRPDASDTLTHQFDIWPVTPRGEGAGDRVNFFVNGTLSGFDGNGIRDGYRAERGAGPHPDEGWRSELFSPTYLDAEVSFEEDLSQEGVSSDQEHSVWTIPLVPGTLGQGTYLRTPEGFEVLGQGSLGTDPNAYSHYVSAGGAHVIFSSKGHLEPDAAPAPTKAIYDRATGTASAEVVSLGPGNSPFAAGEDATYLGSTEDGKAVAFEVAGALYLRNDKETFEVSKAPNTFAGISEDGKQVFFADADLAAPVPGPAALSVFDVETEATTGIASNARFVNVSADGSHVYFTSQGQIGGEGTAGQDNLYVWNKTTKADRFIGLLNSSDFAPQGFLGENDNLVRWPAAVSGGARATSPTRSTPDGLVFVFQSYAQLTSYDNTEADAAACGDPKASGDRCLEIYRYDDRAPAGERIICVSCDQTGARPSGASILQQLLTGSSSAKRFLIPNVTEDGTRIVFQSDRALLPEDANSGADVYEWLAPGTGGCARTGGCLALISSGQGAGDSILYGMTPDGHDVFFTTLEKLTGADVSGSNSIYDAREGGGIPEPPAPSPCQGDACQGQGSTPPAVRTPASDGAGGGDEPPPAACAKGRHRVKGRCVPRSHKHRRRHHRSNHKRRAGR